MVSKVHNNSLNILGPPVNSQSPKDREKLVEPKCFHLGMSTIFVLICLGFTAAQDPPAANEGGIDISGFGTDFTIGAPPSVFRLFGMNRKYRNDIFYESNSLANEELILCRFQNKLYSKGNTNCRGQSRQENWRSLPGLWTKEISVLGQYRGH